MGKEKERMKSMSVLMVERLFSQLQYPYVQISVHLTVGRTGV